MTKQKIGIIKGLDLYSKIKVDKYQFLELVNIKQRRIGQEIKIGENGYE